jgi:hypothetical protein
VHQHAHHTVAHRRIHHIQEQPVDGVIGLVLHHEGVLGDGAMEEVGGGVDHVLALDALEGFQRLIIDLASGQRLGVGQAQVGAEEQR